MGVCVCMLLCYEICFYIVRHQCKAVQFGSKNSGWDYYTRSRFRYKGLISIYILFNIPAQYMGDHFWGFINNKLNMV